MHRPIAGRCGPDQENEESEIDRSIDNHHADHHPEQRR
jgi:hypothetical protein